MRNLIQNLLFIMLLFGVWANDGFAQQKYNTKSKKAIKFLEEGLRMYDSKRNTEAIPLFEKSIKADNEFIDPYILLAESHYEIGDAETGIEYFEKVISMNAEYFRNTYYRIAQMQLSIGRYRDARENLEAFMNVKRVNPKIREEAERGLETARFGEVAIKKPVPFEPKNIGANVNTDQYEYFPVLTADEQTLVFTKNQRRQGAMDYQEDFYISFLGESGWSKAMNLGAPINTEDNEGAQTITADGSQLFFIGCNKRGGKGSCDIYYSLREGKKWGAPINLGAPINTSKWESQPSVSADGKTLYFASNRPGSLGGADIWETHLAPNGVWTEPRNLGETINTKYSEETPFIHPDGQTLYFTSNGHPGFGQKDIYFTKLDENGLWSEPKNLGYPINTWKDEMGLFVAASGETAYFSSDREGGFGKLDIYSFPLYKEARPVRVTYVKGTVTDKETGKPVGAKFELIDLATSKLVVESASDKISGKFLVTLPADRDYALNVSKDEYLFYSDNFSLKDKKDVSDPYRLNVMLQPIKFGEKVVLKNIFFETGSFELLEESKAELEKLRSFMVSNPNIMVEIGGHTDNVGKPEDNITLSQNRARAVFVYLTKNGIVNSRITYKGYGETIPIATNETAEGRALNRRTEFTVLQKK